ncbi:MAG: hypothetical protein CVU00_15440 [Bacteroidetes bacterium HGW-Bacteroidetes-17]|jgi:uncharacterized protein (TIGR02145 family)|nr:MAG: hypothetical protein CVU00_15440 [Bacteroidetes bacterium HGW-Bacteroidetes-17]
MLNRKKEGIMKKSLFLFLLLATVVGGIIFQSCKDNEAIIEPQLSDEGIVVESISSNSLKSVGCIDPGNPVYSKVNAQQTINWGSKNNPFSKTVSIVFYNTETHFILEVMSTNGWANLVIDGISSWTDCPVAAYTWGVYQKELPIDWAAGDAFNLTLQVVGHGPQAKFNVSYELIGLCGTTFGTMTDIEGKTYETVVIGELEWMRENLGTMTFNNGEAIPTGFSAEDWVNYTATGPAVELYWQLEYGPLIPELREELHQKYGALYNFNAVVDPRGLCPTGWRVSTEQDWNNLISYVTNLNNFEVGNQLKSCRQENSPLGGECATTEHPYWVDVDHVNYGIDAYGFSAIPGGWRNELGGYGNLGIQSSYWTSTPALYQALPRGYAYGMNSDISNIFKFDEIIEIAQSVRCVRDKN